MKTDPLMVEAAAKIAKGGLAIAGLFGATILPEAATHIAEAAIASIGLIYFAEGINKRKRAQPPQKEKPKRPRRPKKAQPKTGE